MTSQEPTVWEVAEELAMLNRKLQERRDPSLEGALDVIYGAVADLDALAGGIARPGVRELLRDA